MPAASRTGRFNNKKIVEYIKKARESVPVTRPAYQGLRTAHSVWTSNAEAHADMYDITNTPFYEKYVKGINISRRHPLLLCFWLSSKCSKFWYVKDKTSSKRLSLYKYISHTALTSRIEVSAWETQQMYAKKCN